MPKFDQLWKRVALHACFALAAPVGTAVGLIMRSQLDEEGASFLVVVGLCEAISAGVLIYVSLVHMVLEELSRPEFAVVQYLKTALYSGFLLGSAAMSLIGIWA